MYENLRISETGKNRIDPTHTTKRKLLCIIKVRGREDYFYMYVYVYTKLSIYKKN